ncbi:unnamed protein product, partial [marine sediment metagenome]
AFLSFKIASFSNEKPEIPGIFISFYLDKYSSISNTIAPNLRLPTTINDPIFPSG